MSAEEYVPDRLRALGYPSHANEVERLIGKIARLQAELARVRGLPRLSQLDDENKRLRAALEIAKDALERGTGNYSFVLQAIADALANEREGKNEYE